MDQEQRSKAGRIKLTIAIPIYNGAKTICETLDNILAQIEDGVDIVISDNASIDNTAHIIDKYIAQYPFIKYYRNEENIGADGNFDQAVRRAEGDFVWLFSDDYIMSPGGIRKILSVIGQNHDVGAIFVNWFNLDDGSVGKLGTKHDTYCRDGNQFLNLVRLYPLLVSANIIRRSLWREAETVDFIGTNWIHYLALVTAVSKMPSFVVSEPFVGYRRGTGGWKNDHYLRLQINFNLIVSLSRLFTVYGLDSKLLYCLKRIAISDLHLIWGCRRHDVTIPGKDIKRLFKLYCRYPIFWLRSVPLFWLPKSLLGVIQWLNTQNKCLRSWYRKGRR